MQYYSIQVTVNRKRKLEQLAQSDGLTIQDLMQKLRAKRGVVTTTACPPPSLSNPPLLPPNTPIDVLRYDIATHKFSSEYSVLLIILLCA